MGNIEWNRTFGGNGSDMEAFSIQQTKDGGYIINGLKDKNAWLVKTDKEGNETWEKTFGGKGYLGSIKQTKDGGYILAGTTDIYGSGDDDIWLMKVSGESLKTPEFEAIFLLLIIFIYTYIKRK